MTNPSLQVVDRGPTGLALHSRIPLAAGEVVFDLGTCTPVPVPDRYSIQIAADRHVDAGPVRYLNHSCAPSTLIDTERLNVTAVRDLAAGEELTFFYPATEWDMARPFRCRCTEPDCLGEIRGGRYLDTTALARWMISPHVRELHHRAGGAAASSEVRAV
jgi:hypothetical protein